MRCRENLPDQAGLALLADIVDEHDGPASVSGALRFAAETGGDLAIELAYEEIQDLPRAKRQYFAERFGEAVLRADAAARAAG